LNIIFASLPMSVSGYVTPVFVGEDFVWISHTPTSALCATKRTSS